MGRATMRWLVLAGVLCCAAVAQACSIPVFRYALERWPADAYTIHVYHRGPLRAPERALADELRQTVRAGAVNARVELVDLAGEPTRALRDLWEAQHGATLPWVVLRAPWDDEPTAWAWAGPLTAHHVQHLCASPARAEIAKRISTGESVVWVFVPGGDRARDDAALARVKATLAHLERTLDLPAPVDGNGRDIQPPSPVPPLKLAFSTLVLAQGGDESIFLRILRHSDPHAAKLTGPTVYPVFGQGRALAALAGKGLEADELQAAAEYLIGACACEVKEQNPGNDLLMTADWAAMIGRSATAAPVLPLLPTDQTGRVTAANPAAALRRPTTAPPPATPQVPSAMPSVPAPVSAAPSAPREPEGEEEEERGARDIAPVEVVPLPQEPRPAPNHLGRNLAIALAAGLGIVLGAALFARSRAKVAT